MLPKSCDQNRNILKCHLGSIHRRYAVASSIIRLRFFYGSWHLILRSSIRSDFRSSWWDFRRTTNQNRSIRIVCDNRIEPILTQIDASRRELSIAFFRGSERPKIRILRPCFVDTSKFIKIWFWSFCRSIRRIWNQRKNTVRFIALQGLGLRWPKMIKM